MLAQIPTLTTGPRACCPMEGDDCFLGGIGDPTPCHCPGLRWMWQ